MRSPPLSYSHHCPLSHPHHRLHFHHRPLSQSQSSLLSIAHFSPPPCRPRSCRSAFTHPAPTKPHLPDSRSFNSHFPPATRHSFAFASHRCPLPKPTSRVAPYPFQLSVLPAPPDFSISEHSHNLPVLACDRTLQNHLAERSTSQSCWANGSFTYSPVEPSSPSRVLTVDRASHHLSPPESRRSIRFDDDE